MKRLAFALLVPALLAADWPQWRGPKNDGHAPGEAGIPADWSAEKNVLWKAPMPGPGASTPAVGGGRLFFTAQVGSDLELHAFTTEGKPVWKRLMGRGEGKYRGDEGNMASASCTLDAGRVFAFVGTGAVGAYKAETGEPVWEFDAQERYGKFRIQFGAHWSPVLHDGRLYLQLFHQNGTHLVALDAATGKEVWKVERTSDSPPGVESPDVYSSPAVYTGPGGPLLIAHGDDYCTAHKLTDGSEVWRVAGLNPKGNYNRHWRAVASPLVSDGLIVVPSCKNGVVVGVDPATAKGEVVPGNPAELWRLPKGTPDVPTPILVDGVVYLMRENGELTSHDAKTGKQLGSEKLTNERHRASPVYADGKLILVGREGNMATVKPGRDFEVLAKSKLPDTFTASPAVSGGRVYLRGWNYLWAVGVK